MLDSCTDVPLSALAAFGEERRAWLEARLAEAADRPTIVSLRHPPFNTGIIFLDADGPGWADGLVEVLSRYPNVERVLCGHVHRSTQTLVGGRLATMCPSTGYAVRLELRDPPTGHFMEMEPADFQLHLWTDGRMLTHTLFIDRYREADPAPPELMAKLAVDPSFSAKNVKF
jgi:3',5'-cyclic AMP phosphodiesterase CpdA